MHRTFQIAIFCAGLGVSIHTHAQSQREHNTRALKPYTATRAISILEWELLQFNLLWQGSLDGTVNYVNSFPVMYDPKAVRFRATFSIQEKREHNDPEPFFKLPRSKRESILQGAVDQLVALLGQRFPEVKSNRGLVYAEFWFHSSGGGRSVVATFKDGVLSLAE